MLRLFTIPASKQDYVRFKIITTKVILVLGYAFRRLGVYLCLQCGADPGHLITVRVPNYDHPYLTKESVHVGKDVMNIG